MLSLLSNYIKMQLKSFLVVHSIICLVNSAPISNENGMKYLMNFGYTNNKTIELMTKEEQAKAIEHFQKYANITVTGVLDEKTKQMMQKPRCQMPDTNTKIIYYLGRWNHTLLTYKFINFPIYNFNETTVVEELTKAMKLWIDQVDLVIRRVYDEDEDADIDIEFVERAEISVSVGYVLAYARPPVEGDIYYVDEDWSDQDVDLLHVGAHEFGHSLGLEHSNDSNSVMYPIFEPREHFQLHSSDIEQIKALYGDKYSLCKDGNIDAAVNPSQNIVFLIRKTQVWKYINGKLSPEYPKILSEEWPGLNSPVNGAFYYNNDYYFLQDKNVLIFAGNKTQHFYYLDKKYDAAVTIGERLYTFKDSKYWRYDFTENKMSMVRIDYPREISRLWKGVPGHVDAVYYDGNAHFFKGQKYYLFDTNALFNNATEKTISEWEGCLK